MSIPEWFAGPLSPLNEVQAKQALARQNELTKPPGSLGKLEELAIKLSTITESESPRVDDVHISIFAADHGIAAQGVSAFPQSVTAEMVRNFANGGAAISVLSQTLGARLEIINVGTVSELESMDGVIDNRIGNGTADFSQQAAMNEHQLSKAIHAGRQTAERAKLNGTELFIAGEMGIANTSSATALVCALLNQPARSIAGRGTGLDDAALAHKITVIDDAIAKHSGSWTSPWQCLAVFGGFEIAALAGAYIACARMNLPVLVDGFIASSAALVANHICPGVGERLFYAHRSAEPGHQLILSALDAEPLLDLNMRLGEGSGAAVAVPLLRMACSLHNGMASFSQAGVSNKEP